MSEVPFAFIPSPSSNGVHLGPFYLHAYGLAYAFAVAAAIAITVRRWQAKGGNPELVYEVALWGFPAGVIGGRLYFLATSWNEVPPHWWGVFAVWKGGLGIWGGIAGGTLAGLWVLRRRGANIPQFLDAAAPALLIAQAIGRIGNYFNQELFGGPTTLPWGLQIAPAHRPLGYAQYATFHPTFLYELIWNLLLAGALVWLGRHRRIRAPGLFALYVAGYSFARIGEELLRVDPAHHIFGLRLNLYVASILCLAGVAWFVRIQWASRPRSKPTAVRRGGALLAAGGLLALIPIATGCGSSSHTPPGLAISGPGLQTSQPASGSSQAPWQPEYVHLAQRLKLIGIPAGGKEKFHIHALLHIYINGLLTPLPAEIGLDPAKGIESSMHTHDGSGIIHMEAPHPFNYTLGDFFSVWGVKLGPAQVGGLSGYGGNRLHFFLNGKPLSNPAALVLHKDDSVVIGYGPPNGYPHSPSKFLLSEVDKGEGGLGCGATKKGRKTKSCLAPKAPSATPKPGTS